MSRAKGVNRALINTRYRKVRDGGYRAGNISRPIVQNPDTKTFDLCLVL